MTDESKEDLTRTEVREIFYEAAAAVLGIARWVQKLDRLYYEHPWLNQETPAPRVYNASLDEWELDLLQAHDRWITMSKAVILDVEFVLYQMIRTNDKGRRITPYMSFVGRFPTLEMAIESLELVEEGIWTETGTSPERRWTHSGGDYRVFEERNKLSWD